MKKLSKALKLFLKYAEAFEGNCENCGVELKLGIADPYSSLCISCLKKKHDKTMAKMFGFEEEFKKKKENKENETFLKSIKKVDDRWFEPINIGYISLNIIAGENVYGCEPKENFYDITKYSTVKVLLDDPKENTIFPTKHRKLSKFNWTKYWDNDVDKGVGRFVPVSIVEQIIKDLQDIINEKII